MQVFRSERKTEFRRSKQGYPDVGEVVGQVVRSFEPKPKGGKREIWVASSKHLSGVFHDRDRAEAENWLVKRLKLMLVNGTLNFEPISKVEKLIAALEQIKALAAGIPDEQLCKLDGLQDGDVHVGQLLFNAKEIAVKALEA